MLHFQTSLRRYRFGDFWLGKEVHPLGPEDILGAFLEDSAYLCSLLFCFVLFFLNYIKTDIWNSCFQSCSGFTLLYTGGEKMRGWV